MDTSIGNLFFALSYLREKMGCFSRPAFPRVGCGPCPPALVMDCLFDIYCNIFLCGQQESPAFHARFSRGSGAHTMRCHVTEKRTEIGKLSPRGTDKTCTQAVYAGEKPAHRCRYLAAWFQAQPGAAWVQAQPGAKRLSGFWPDSLYLCYRIHRGVTA